MCPDRTVTTVPLRGVVHGEAIVMRMIPKRLLPPAADAN
jgi:hypothetical protein